MKVRHYEMTRAQRLFSIASLAAAISLLAMLAIRTFSRIDAGWWTLPMLIAGVAASDLASGLVHWAADTWGDDDLPVVGRRLLKPFRLHHIDPDDFLRRSFVDANGDVAFVTVPVLLVLLWLPLDTPGAVMAATCGLGFCGVGMWTNQIHQWAHMPSPPAVIGLLQDAGVVLGRADHAAHHRGEFDRHYCITTGWWNRPLEAIEFFRRLETAITAWTGARPREDDRRYAI
jgi:ubiquitin-conjugating enzyme E2 variant